MKDERLRIAPEAPLDQDYKKMMTWVAIALVGAVAAALIIVELVMRRYGP